MSVLSEIEDRIISTHEHLKLKKDLFSISIEALQNITKHQNSTASTKVSFLLTQDSGGFQIQTVNSLKSDRKEALKNRLSYINSLTLAQLKEHHQLSLKNRLHTQNGSAGLGLIQMARKSKKKLEYEFVDLNKEFVQFQLTINIANT